MRLEEFLFCEMARNEQNGQLSLVGLYPGSTVIFQLPPEIALQLIPNLHAVVILGQMERISGLRYQCDVKQGGHDIITTPSQHVERPTPLPPFQNLLFGFSPFPCTRGPGDYNFRITVQPDGAANPTTYSKRFRIQKVGLPARH